MSPTIVTFTAIPALSMFTSVDPLTSKELPVTLHRGGAGFNSLFLWHSSESFLNTLSRRREQEAPVSSSAVTSIPCNVRRTAGRRVPSPTTSSRFPRMRVSSGNNLALRGQEYCNRSTLVGCWTYGKNGFEKHPADEIYCEGI